MAVPTLRELQVAQRKEELVSESGSPFVRALELMPEKRRAFVLAMLADPQATLPEQAKSAGLTVPQAQSAFREVAGKLGPALLRLGGTEADLVRVLMEGLRAEKAHITKDGAIITTPDMPTRLAAFREACKLGGYYPDPRLLIDKHETKTFGIAQNTIDALKDRRAAQKAVDTTYEEVRNG